MKSLGHLSIRNTGRDTWTASRFIADWQLHRLLEPGLLARHTPAWSPKRVNSFFSHTSRLLSYTHTHPSVNINTHPSTSQHTDCRCRERTFRSRDLLSHSWPRVYQNSYMHFIWTCYDTQAPPSTEKLPTGKSNLDMWENLQKVNIMKPPLVILFHFSGERVCRLDMSSSFSGSVLMGWCRTGGRSDIRTRFGILLVGDDRMWWFYSFHGQV